MNDFKEKKTIVIGLAKSGVAAAEKLKEAGAEVFVVDCADDNELRLTAQKLEAKGIRTRLGLHRLSDLNHRELVIASPGVPKSNPMLIEAHRQKIPIWSEIELAFRFTRNPIIGVTGTNGKTTVTTLIGKLLKASGKSVVVSGNIGHPMTASLKELKRESIMVVELSSFQLEHIEKFRPWVAVLLNITEDHLDWHSDFADYIQAKRRVFENQTKEDFAVLNIDDEIVRSLASRVKAQIIPCSKSERCPGGVYLENGWIISELDAKKPIFKVADLKIKGEHNLDNVMSSIAAAQIAGVRMEIVRQVLAEFKGLKHRIEFVRKIKGVSYYNDSKATNPDATVKALTAFDQPLILLAGGRNKKNSFSALAKAIEKKAKAVVLFGEAAGAIKAALSPDKVKIFEETTLPEAVERAAVIAVPGDAILLSPACASFDQFQDYEQRGRVFADSVEKQAEKVEGVPIETESN